MGVVEQRAKATSENEVFAVCWRNRVVLDAAAHILGSTFEVGSVDLRDPSPGYGEQVVAVGAAGSLLLRDARLFHAAGRNSTTGHRRSAFIFVQPDIPDGVVGSA